MPAFALSFDVSPFRLSGTVYGVLMNHRSALEGLGEVAHRPPYKAPPTASRPSVARQQKRMRCQRQRPGR